MMYYSYMPLQSSTTQQKIAWKACMPLPAVENTAHAGLLQLPPVLAMSVYSIV